MIGGRSTASIAAEGAIYGFAFAVGWVAAFAILGVAGVVAAA
jgi:hypothetical protein